MLFSCRLCMLYIDFQLGVYEQYYINNGATVVVWFVVYIYTNLHFVQSKEIFIGQVHPISSSRQRRFNNRKFGDISSPGFSCGWLLFLLLNHLRDAITMNMHTNEMTRTHTSTAWVILTLVGNNNCCRRVYRQCKFQYLTITNT
jgi:hypothetical protein